MNLERTIKNPRWWLVVPVWIALFLVPGLVSLALTLGESGFSWLARACRKAEHWLRDLCGPTMKRLRNYTFTT